MGRSSVQFDRWKPREKSTWVFRVFKQHNAELLRMFTAFENSQKYTFKNLGKSKAKLSDLPSQHFDYNHAKEYDQYKDLSDWTSAFNDLENWINLNALVTISSNFETYLSTVIPLALSSDLGVLYGVPNKIDGIDILKNGHESPFDFKNIVIIYVGSFVIINLLIQSAWLLDIYDFGIKLFYYNIIYFCIMSFFFFTRLMTHHK